MCNGKSWSRWIMECLQRRKERKRMRDSVNWVGNGNAQVCRCRVLQERREKKSQNGSDEFFNRAYILFWICHTCCPLRVSLHPLPLPPPLSICFYCVNFRFHSVKCCIIILVYCSTMLKVYCIVRCTQTNRKFSPIHNKDGTSAKNPTFWFLFYRARKICW